MYYEEAIVKTYERTYKNKKVPYNQIHLGKESKFNNNSEVAVINIDDFKEILNTINGTGLNEIEDNYKHLQEEHFDLNEEHNSLKTTIATLTSQVETLTEEKIQLQEKLLVTTKEQAFLIKKTNTKIEDANNKVIKSKDKIEELQQEHKKEIADKDSQIKELNSKLNNEKDFSKKLLAVINTKNNDIVYLASRGLRSRIRNKLTDRIKQVIENKTNDVEIKSVEDIPEK